VGTTSAIYTRHEIAGPHEPGAEHKRITSYSLTHMKDSKSHQGTARLSARTVACRRLLKMTLLSSVWGGKSSEPVRVHAMTNAVQGTSVLALADNGAAGEPSSAEAPAAELMMELNATAAPPGDAFSQ
jgi:hypothetical protein